MSTRQQNRRAAKVDVIRPDAGVWRRALALAEGDVRRLTVRADGTVVVHNQPVR